MSQLRKLLSRITEDECQPSILDPSYSKSAELERAAYQAYRIEMYERRRTPFNEQAVLAAKEVRKQAEYLASQHAYATTGI